MDGDPDPQNGTGSLEQQSGRGLTARNLERWQKLLSQELDPEPEPENDSTGWDTSQNQDLYTSQRSSATAGLRTQLSNILPCLSL